MKPGDIGKDAKDTVVWLGSGFSYGSQDYEPYRPPLGCKFFTASVKERLKRFQAPRQHSVDAPQVLRSVRKVPFLLGERWRVPVGDLREFVLRSSQILVRRTVS